MPDDQLDTAAIRGLAARVKARHSEPGADRSAYLLAIQAGNLLDRIAELEGERDDARNFVTAVVALVPEGWGDEAPLPPLPADGSRPPLITAAAVALTWVVDVAAKAKGVHLHCAADALAAENARLRLQVAELAAMASLPPTIIGAETKIVTEYSTEGLKRAQKLSEDYTRVMTERDNARSDAERAQLALALAGGGADPNGYYAGTPGARVRDLLAAEKERDGLRAEVEAMRPVVEGVSGWVAQMRGLGLGETAADILGEDILDAVDLLAPKATETTLRSTETAEQPETVPESTDGAQEGAQGAWEAVTRVWHHACGRVVAILETEELVCGCGQPGAWRTFPPNTATGGVRLTGEGKPDDLDKLTADPAEALAQQFHEAYERLAPSFGYETREASAKPWAEVPDNNRRLMTAVCAELLDRREYPQAEADTAGDPAGLDAAIEAAWRSTIAAGWLHKAAGPLGKMITVDRAAIDVAVRAAAPHIRRAALIEAENLPVASSGGYIDEQQRRIEEHGAEMLRRAIRERAEREVGP